MMKKLFVVSFALCALALTGTLIADSTPADAPAATLELADVLPGTVLDQVTADAFQLCPRPDFYCLDVWDPVTCDNGVTYSNQCYADRACATGCTPGGATY